MSKSKKMSGRPKQPKCPECGKALYKRMDPGQVKKSDPYAWCRNKACALHNRPQETSRFSPLGADDGKVMLPAAEPDATEAAESEAKRAKRAKKVAPSPEAPAEPEAVAKARARIKKVMDAAETQFGANAVGLALALVTQEMGSHEAANALIAEYQLDKHYGIEPRGADA